MKRYKTGIWGGLCALVILLVGVISNYRFMSVDESTDGFSMQIATAGTLITQWAATDLLTDSWLPLIHVVRLIAVGPFLGAEFVLGAAGPLALLLMLLWPLTRMPLYPVRSLITMFPLALPLMVSGRSVLVAVGIGLIVMHLLERRHLWMLWVGGLLSNLSSASVLIALLLLIFSRINPRGAKLPIRIYSQRIMVFLLLLASFVISAIDKISGFNSGSGGYEAHGLETENILVQVFSRSTIAVSFYEGQYIRALIYSVISALLFLIIVKSLVRKNEMIGRRIVLCCVPGVLLEGLGVLALLFPLIWLLRGFPADARQLARPVS